MSQDDILGIVRHFLTTAAGALVANGTINDSQAQQLVGGVVVILTIAWSLYQKFGQRKALAAANPTQPKGTN